MLARHLKYSWLFKCSTLKLLKWRYFCHLHGETERGSTAASKLSYNGFLLSADSSQHSIQQTKMYVMPNPNWSLFNTRLKHIFQVWGTGTNLIFNACYNTFVTIVNTYGHDPVMAVGSRNGKPRRELEAYVWGRDLEGDLGVPAGIGGEGGPIGEGQDPGTAHCVYAGLTGRV